MEILVVGDTHGNTKSAVRLVNHADTLGCTKIIQCGDFGLWSHFESGIAFLDTLNTTLRLKGIKLYAIGGNHENWDHWNWHIENSPKDGRGFTYLRSHILIAPRTHIWEWNGRMFGSVAGGVSIDWKYRRAMESENTRTLWWPTTPEVLGEQITDEEIEALPERKLDYLFTHDCSDRTQFKNRFKPDMESQIHRQRIDRALSKLRPEYHFHGHMHEKYDWVNSVPSTRHGIRTIGLECDGMIWNWIHLDSEKNEVDWMRRAD